MVTLLAKFSTFSNLGFWEILKGKPSEIIGSAMAIVRLREPIDSLVFGKTRSGLTGKPIDPESRRFGKGYKEISSYQVMDWLSKFNTYVWDW